MTPLKGADSQVYAIAQGNILVGGAGASAGGSSVQINQLNGGRISGGAIIERGVPTTFARRLYLPGNEHRLRHRAERRDGAEPQVRPGHGDRVGRPVVQVRTPMDQSAQARFLSQIEDVQGGARAHRGQVIINARTGSVVMNRTVMIEEAAVAHGNLSVIINRQNQVSQPDTPFTQGQTVVVPNTQIEVRQENGSLQRVNTSANLADVVKGLNALGATPQDLLAILQAMKSAARCAPNSRLFNGKAPRSAARFPSGRRGGPARPDPRGPVGTMDN